MNELEDLKKVEEEYQRILEQSLEYNEKLVQLMEEKTKILENVIGLKDALIKATIDENTINFEKD